MVRRAELVSRREGDEILVLDVEAQAAHCLVDDVARVWEAIETPADVSVIATRSGLERAAVARALATLAELGLVRTAGVSRRALTRGVAVGGAAVAAGVVSIPLPAAARANSSTFTITNPTCPLINVLVPPQLTFTLNLTSGRLTPNTTYTVTYAYTTGSYLLGVGGALGVWLSSVPAPTDSFTFTSDASGRINGGAGVTHTTPKGYHGGLTSFTVSAGANDQTSFTPPVIASC